MVKLKMIGAFAVVVGILLISAAPALAEFTSQNKETKGEGESIEMTLEAGGGIIKCQAYSESASKATWKIENKGSPASSGPDLRFDVEKWGECEAESGEFKDEKAEVSGCEFEVAQTGEETFGPGRVLTACTVKVVTCEIKVEPIENEKVSGFDLAASGDKDENLIIESTAMDLATKTKGTCPGIKASKEGKLIGIVQMNRVQPRPLAEYAIGTSRARFTAMNNTGSITILRLRGKMETIAILLFRPTRAGLFTEEEPAKANCVMKMYATLNETCAFGVTYISTVGPGSLSIFVQSRNGGISRVVLTGT